MGSAARWLRSREARALRESCPAQTAERLQCCSVSGLQHYVSCFSVACCRVAFHVAALRYVAALHYVAALRFMLQRVFHIAALLHVAALRSMLQRGFHVSRCMLRFPCFRCVPSGSAMRATTPGTVGYCRVTHGTLKYFRVSYDTSGTVRYWLAYCTAMETTAPPQGALVRHGRALRRAPYGPSRSPSRLCRSRGTPEILQWVARMGARGTLLCCATPLLLWGYTYCAADCRVGACG
jgi:hypothetical protein